VAEAAAQAGEPGEAFRRLPDYERYADLARRLRRRLEERLSELNLGEERRVAFYALGAGVAAVLDRSDGDWKQRYAEQLFTLLPP
jgi:hypothetical protein